MECSLHQSVLSYFCNLIYCRFSGYYPIKLSGFYKVVHVLVYNTVLCLYRLNKCELGLDNRWVLAGSSLAIVQAGPLLLQLRCVFYEVVNLVLANRLRVACAEQSISHILYRKL
jgi:hypothetical protein